MPQNFISIYCMWLIKVKNKFNYVLINLMEESCSLKFFIVLQKWNSTFKSNKYNSSCSRKQESAREAKLSFEFKKETTYFLFCFWLEYEMTISLRRLAKNSRTLQQIGILKFWIDWTVKFVFYLLQMCCLLLIFIVFVP